MIDENKINIIFQYSNRKFEVSMFPEESASNLISIIRETIIKRVTNKKNSDGKNIQIISENIIINKLSTPKQIHFSDSMTLREANFSENEEVEVIIKQNDCPEKENSKEKENKGINNDNQIEFKIPDLSKFSIRRKAIPGDNSCLFNAINYALNQCMTEPQILRELIAVEIKSNPELYNQAVLEVDPLDYCDWIMRNDTWGGGIELAILSKFFRVRIDVVDLLNNTIERIGDMFSRVMFLLYNGSHYDVFIKQDKDGQDIGIFEVSDIQTRKEVISYANELYKIYHNFDFSYNDISCSECKTNFEYAGELLNHFESTNHKNFTKIPKNTT